METSLLRESLALGLVAALFALSGAIVRGLRALA